jgi:D-inositol-3-phosphate glycosyltransferase
MKKRIAILSYHTCPLAAEEGKETGGMNVYVLSTGRELAKMGHQVDVFTRSQDPRQPKIVQVDKNFRVIHVKAGEENYILPNSEENKKQFFAAIPEFVTNIQAFQKDEGKPYEVFDAHYYLSGLVAKELKKDNPQALFLMTFHTLALMKNLTNRNGLSEQEIERVKAESFLTNEADIVISPSNNEKKYVQYLYDTPSSKIRVISPGVDTKLFRPMDKVKAKKAIDASLDHKMILFVGRIDPVKGLDVLLYAIKIFLEKHPEYNACLWIVGGDTTQEKQLWSAELQKLEQLRKLLSLNKTTVKFVGQQPQHKLPVYYNAADLVVMPSHYESFGMTALEAMSCGTPLITTNVTGVSELLDERYQKHITAANNPLLLADKIADVLCYHKGDDHTMLENIADYDWKNVAERITKLYE